MILITFALPAESSELIKRLREKRTPDDRDNIVYGKINAVPVGIFHTGVGAKICGPRITHLLSNLRPNFLISAGFAGSIRDALRPGDLVLAENFSDENLLARARQALSGQNPRVVKIFTSTKIVDSREDGNEIVQMHGADAVDMETATISVACASHQVPMLSLRVISDSLNEPLPAPPRVLFDIERQRTNYVKLALYVLRHPGAIPSLLRFSQRIARAREALTEASITIVQSL